nr:protein FAR1-RELATED SEQUENCE 5-like [Aegilops tauschii subsp. strangulata]
MINLNELPDDDQDELPPSVGLVQTAGAEDEAVHIEEHTLDATDTLGATGGTIGHEGAGEGADNDDEAWSQPKEPSSGMRFDTLEGAREHYNAYALQKVFSIKMNTPRRSDITGQMEKYQFVCNKFRKPKNKDTGGKTADPCGVEDPRGGADDDDGEDNVIIFVDDDVEQKNKTKNMQKTDADFFYKVKYDAEDRVENIFWVDGPAKKAYNDAYHDFICFDTTYMTNMYNMPFAPFIGINRHGQSFMLGCGFVRQELETSFDWLFGTFLKQCMVEHPII